MLVAKILQNIANGVLFQKEEYMLCFNSLIDQQRPRVADALEKISVNKQNSRKAHISGKTNNYRAIKRGKHQIKTKDNGSRFKILARLPKFDK